MMIRSIHNLREVGRRCEEGEPLDQELSYWLSEGIRAFLDRESSCLEHAFGLQVGRGGVPWWKEEAICVRDRALRALVEGYPSDMSVTAKARLLNNLSLRYAASAWRYDRTKEHMPDWYRGTHREKLWIAFNSGAAMPISERQLRSVIMA